MKNTPDEIEEIMKENWHAIEGPNGMCACGDEKGNCNERLREKLLSLQKNTMSDVIGIVIRNSSGFVSQGEKEVWQVDMKSVEHDLYCTRCGIVRPQDKIEK
jgi:hypothetical protein